MQKVKNMCIQTWMSVRRRLRNVDKATVSTLLAATCVAVVQATPARAVTQVGTSSPILCIILRSSG